MNKYFAIIKNWRCVVLTVLWIIALLGIMADSESVRIVIIKVLSLLLGYGTYKLGERWHNAGLIDEIDVFNDNDNTEEKPFGDPEEQHFHGDE